MTDNTEVSLKEKAFAFLQTQNDPVRTIVIAKHCCGKEATRKSVNKYLYELQREGKVAKISNPDGGNPRWSIVQPPPEKGVSGTLD